MPESLSLLSQNEHVETKLYANKDDSSSSYKPPGVGGIRSSRRKSATMQPDPDRQCSACINTTRNCHIQIKAVFIELIP